MNIPPDQTVDQVLARLSEWRRCYEELAELQAQYTELCVATADGQFSRDWRRCLHVMKYRIAELQEKLTAI